MFAFLSAVSSGAVASNLIDAVKNQDSEELQSLLNGGADPNEHLADGATALHWAVFRSETGMVKSLINAGADVNAVNRLGASALYIAAKSGDGDLIELLLDQGANPNLSLKLGETPLMTASRSGSEKAVRRLITAGADVNVIESSREQTALMWAAAQGHVEVARALINAGADLEARSKVRPMLMFAEASNGGAFEQGVMEQLGGYSPLLFAARQGDVEMARLLLSSGADIEGLAANGTSPLVIAAHSGHSKLAQMLLVSGADTNSIAAGYSALHAAILRGDLATAEALIGHGADINVRLVRANPVQRASEDWVLTIRLIGATPYWIAANFRETSIMGALVNAGADPRLTNAEVWSQPIKRADREAYTPQVVGGFETAVQAAIIGDSTRGRYYTQANPDPIGEERLALAAVIAAADQGINLDHSSFTGAMAIHDAASRALPSVLRELLERGADVNSLNGEGQAPLDLAIATAENSDFFDFIYEPSARQAVEVLKEFGAVQAEQ